MGNSKEEEAGKPKKVAVGCQGGGMQAAFTVGVLAEILSNIEKQKDEDQRRFELVGLSGTSAGALCALMVWYGLAPKKGSPGSGSAREAINKLDDFWSDFLARKGAEVVLNFLTYSAVRAEEIEIPVFGVGCPQVLGRFNPYGAIFKLVAACLPSLGVRKDYFDLDKLLADACPALNDNSIDWKNVNTRLLIGASEVVNGLESVFDTDVNKGMQQNEVYYWRQRLPLTLAGVAASGTLPIFREAQYVNGGGHYWLRSSAEILGLPTGFRDRSRQYDWNPARCQRMIVSGRRIAIALRTEGNQR